MKKGDEEGVQLIKKRFHCRRLRRRQEDSRHGQQQDSRGFITVLLPCRHSCIITMF